MERFFTVYGKPSCPFCVKAVDLLNEKGLKFDYINVLEDAASLKKIKDMGCTTVPQIFEAVDGVKAVHVGGFTDLEKYL